MLHTYKPLHIGMLVVYLVLKFTSFHAFSALTSLHPSRHILHFLERKIEPQMFEQYVQSFRVEVPSMYRF